MRALRLISLALAAAALLAAGAPPSASADELLPNPGVETPDESGLAPAFWQTDAWGQNSASFSWTLDAHSGGRAVRVDISSYVSGDAKWMAEPVPVTGGAYYAFSDWYKSSRTSAISVYYETATDFEGGGRWSNLFSGIPPASGWTQYRTGFHMPTGAVRAVFAHFIAGNGYLVTDDHSVQELAAPPGFSQPLVSLTFDNASQAFYDDALPLLASRGLMTTQYVPTEGVSKRDRFMMTAPELAAMHAAGHEIGSHSVTHPDLTTLPDRDLTRELVSSRSLLENITGQQDVISIAYPFGTYDARVIEASRAAGYQSGRSVEEGYNSKIGFEPFDIRVQNMTGTTTLAEFQSWVDYARLNHYWLVIVYHEVVPDSAPVCTVPVTVSPCLGEWDTRLSSFDQQLGYLVSQGMAGDVRTVSDAFSIVNREIHTPSPGTVALSPAAPMTDQTVTASPQGFVDPDGDALTYRYAWSLNGAPLAGATGATLDLAQPGFGDVGDVVGVSVTGVDPSGNESGGATATATVVAPPPPPSGDGSGGGSTTPSPSTPPCDTTTTASPTQPGGQPATPADRAGPRITITSPSKRTYRSRRVSFRFSARDVSGIGWIKGRLRLPSGHVKTVRRGAVLRLQRGRRYVFKVTSGDRCGNGSAKTVVFRISR